MNAFKKYIHVAEVDDNNDDPEANVSSYVKIMSGFFCSFYKLQKCVGIIVHHNHSKG